MRTQTAAYLQRCKLASETDSAEGSAIRRAPCALHANFSVMQNYVGDVKAWHGGIPGKA